MLHGGVGNMTIAPHDSSDRHGAQPDQPDHRPGVELSVHESRILQLLALGHTQSYVAAELFVSKSTVAAFVTKCLRTLHLPNVTALVAFAITRGVLEANSWPIELTGSTLLL